MIEDLRRTMAMMASMYLDSMAAIDPSSPGRQYDIEPTVAELGELYKIRTEHMWHAVAFASAAGYQVGIKFDPKEPAWPVVYIDLPTGQVSWHITEYPGEWDGHSTEEKYARIAAFAREITPGRIPPCGQDPCEHAPDGGNHPVRGLSSGNVI